MLVIAESLPRFIKQLFQCFTLFNIEEIEAIVRICHIVESKVGLEIFRPQKLLTGANLVKELIKYRKV